MAETELTIANMALGRVGGKKIDVVDDTTNEGKQVGIHYEQTRNSLLRSFAWRFASGRDELDENSSTPDFGWEKQFDLPDDFVKLVGVFEDNGTSKNLTLSSFKIEGRLLLTNDTTVKILYVKQVTDTNLFDPLFIEALVLSLAVKLSMALGQDEKGRLELKRELISILSDIRVVDKQEQETVGRLGLQPWIDQRRSASSGNPAKSFD